MATRDHLLSISNHGVRTVASFTFGTLQLLGLYCCSSLDLIFWNFVEYSISFVPNGFGVANTYIPFTLWNFSQTKEENRIPKPRMNFSTQAKQIVSQEQ